MKTTRFLLFTVLLFIGLANALKRLRIIGTQFNMYKKISKPLFGLGHVNI